MRQVLQELGSGETILAEVPAPRCGHGDLRIKTKVSLVSLGTEKMLIDFAKAGWIGKAYQQPDRVRQALAKMKTEGVLPTLQAIRTRLNQPLALGYCNVGTVLELGPGVPAGQFEPGNRVVSNGPHAEVVSVPRNLCVRVPDGVADEAAAFTVVGAVALHGIRLANPTLGEKFVVIGLGLIGLVTVQLLRAHGCEVLGVDIREDRLGLADQFRAAVVNAWESDVASAAHSWTQGQGVDGVIITASAETDDIMHEAAEACRKRGRIVLVGVVGCNLRRDDFYKKELTFQVSCSYGPGRYDQNYEQGSVDYPLPYVRWTEQRNFEAVLRAMKSKVLNVQPLVTHRFGIEQAPAAYAAIQDDPRALGVILQYPATSSERSLSLSASLPSRPARSSSPSQSNPWIGVIGAGNYARAILLPALAKTSARLACVADLSPIAASHTAREFRFAEATTDHRRILQNERIAAVFIATEHSSHARLVCDSLAASKHIFVEKPLCLTEAELSEIAASYNCAMERNPSPPLLMVGFNRRYSPHTRCIRELLRGRFEPLCMNLTVNAGAVPPDHWLQDAARGGGRIIGEACHFLDLVSFLASSPINRVSAMMAGPGLPIHSDKMSLQLTLVDGSIAALNYFANGSSKYPKETLEIFSEGRILRLENFRVTRGFGFKRFHRFRTWRQDKGHRAEIALFMNKVRDGGPPMIPFAELENVTRASFAALVSVANGKRIQL